MRAKFDRSFSAANPTVRITTKRFRKAEVVISILKPAPKDSRLDAALSKARDQLLETRHEAGHWVGRLSSSALSTATAISALSFYRQSPNSEHLEQINHQISAGIGWVVAEQNDDGGWGDTPQSYSNISTTMLVVAALHAANQDEKFKHEISAAQKYIESQGGIAGLRQRYGVDKTFAVPILANCAMAGIVSWKEVSALPFEAAWIPQRYYHLMQLPVVSYAIPALVAIGQVKFKCDPPRNPILKLIRKSAIAPSLRVLEKMQPSTGGFLEAVPLTSFVCMGLVESGQFENPVVSNGIQFLLDSFRAESSGQGSWPIDTNLATWNTTLAVNALSNSSFDFAELIRADRIRWQQCLEWILSCQNRSVHPFTGAAPGGWGWSDLSGAVPDADDTPGALLALKALLDSGEFEESMKEKISKAAGLGADWLIRLQNRDLGWPTFCRGWGKLPFDRSGSDITAHAIRGLLAWQLEFRSTKLEKAIQNGFRFLERSQLKDGSWDPLWFGNQDQPGDRNPFYGTAKVLMAYRDANSFDTNPARNGLRWLSNHQNEDGGWGGGASLDSINGGPLSSVEETSLCTEVLIDDPDERSQAAALRGIDWLMDAVESNRIGNFSPIGFYFAKLWYYEELYPLIFATAALGRQRNQPIVN